MKFKRTTLRTFLARLSGVIASRQRDEEFADEMREHLHLLEEKFVSQGLTRAEAAKAARRQFGNTSLLGEERREIETFPWMRAAWQDLRYASRTLRKSWGFTGAVVAILGLGIGAATAIFSVVDNVLLEPFPYQGADRIASVRIHGAEDGENGGRQGYTSAEYLEFAGDNRVFEAMTAAREDLVMYRNGKGAEQLDGARVTPGTFEFFGMPAFLGRVLRAPDYEPGAPPVFVMRYKTWQERFHGDESILNKEFILNGTARTLVGVMPPRFGWYEADILIPEKPVREADPNAAPSWFMIGRIRRGVSKSQAETDLGLVANAIAKDHAKDFPSHFTVQLVMLGEGVIGRFSATLYTVLAAVGLLLLIACSNVANLMLARAMTREAEIALRSALGAGRGRLIRLLMTESLLLAAGGAIAGIALAWGGLRLLVAGMPPNLIPTETVIELNGRVLLFTACVVTVTALIVGLMPAIEYSRRDLNSSLRDGGKGMSGGARRGWLRDLVVVTEVALSLILLVGAGLLMKSFVALRGVHLGVQSDHVFQTGLILPIGRYKSTEQITTKFVRPLLNRLKSAAGVIDAAESSSFLPYGGAPSKVEVFGKPADSDWQTLYEQVSEGYFRALQVELKEGRTFNEVEESGARRVAVVNQTFARKYLADGKALRQRIRLAAFSDATPDPWFEVIGVVGDVTNNGLQDPTQPQVWIPATIAVEPPPVIAVMMKTTQEPGTIQNLVQQEVWSTDSDVALFQPGALEDRINARLYAGPRFGAVLTTVFGGTGLFLAIAGVYSVLAYAIARRTQEIGIRMALGAERKRILGMVIKNGLQLVAVGTALGIAISLMLVRWMGSQLIGVTAYDPTTLLIAPLLLLLTAAFACWIPARRAASVDPMIALRYP